MIGLGVTSDLIYLSLTSFIHSINTEQLPCDMHYRFWGYDGENRHRNPCPHGAYILAGGAFCGKKEFSQKKKSQHSFLLLDLELTEHIELELLELKEPTQREALLREEMVRLGPGYINSKCLSLVFEPLDV